MIYPFSGLSSKGLSGFLVIIGSCQLLDHIGIWSTLSPFATAINTIHVSDQGHFGMTEMDAKSQELPYLGQVVELADAGKVFYQALKNRQNIQLYCPNKVAQLARNIDSVNVTLDDGKQLTTKLLVAADGAISSCCDMFNISSTSHDFQQTAIIANISTSEPHKGRAFERFTPNGPIALLPMSDNRSSLVWCLPPDEADALLTSSESNFIEALQACFGWRMGEITQVGTRFSYPLLLRQSDKLISHRFAVIGNAAQTLHPIAGQGFNLGLRDVMTLAEEITQAITVTNDSGSNAVLSSYQQRREPDRYATVAMTSSLVHGFSNHSIPFILGRNLGLMAMSAHPHLQAPLIQRALGLVNR